MVRLQPRRPPSLSSSGQDSRFSTWQRGFDSLQGHRWIPPCPGSNRGKTGTPVGEQSSELRLLASARARPEGHPPTPTLRYGFNPRRTPKGVCSSVVEHNAAPLRQQRSERIAPHRQTRVRRHMRRQPCKTGSDAGEPVPGPLAWVRASTVQRRLSTRHVRRLAREATRSRLRTGRFTARRDESAPAVQPWAARHACFRPPVRRRALGRHPFCGPVGSLEPTPIKLNQGGGHAPLQDPQSEAP